MKFAKRFFEGNRTCPQTELQILASKPKPMPAIYINHYIPICDRRVTCYSKGVYSSTCELRRTCVPKEVSESPNRHTRYIMA